MNSGNAYYNSVQNLLSSRLLSKNIKIKIYRTIILYVVCVGVKLGCCHWGEERRLRVFDSRVLRRIFGPKGDEVRRERRKLHNEERNDMHPPPNIIGAIKSRRMRLARYVACKGKRRGAYRILVGKPKEKRPFGRTRRKWEENVKIGLQEVEWGHGLD